ncbi:MAG: nitronate monooxygenase [Alphaproteobacteria bacterium]|nr:nitronate monooxygenase [Alphaproteobacteria bacterium]
MSNWIEALGLKAPIWQAPMAGSQHHKLAAAVSKAGGLGALPAAMLTPDLLAQHMAAVRAQTERPFQVNFFCHQPTTPTPDALSDWAQTLRPYYRELGLEGTAVPQAPGRTPFGPELAEVLEQAPPSVVSFHFGLPDQALLERVKAMGSKVVSSATTVPEALWLEARGVDAIVAQGLEAGGHRGMFLSDELSSQQGLMTLLPQVVAAVKVPVIAAGGIATPAGVRAARALGASGVQVGTVFLLTPEATTSEVHRAALRQAQGHQTALTRLFSGRPARGLMNRLMLELGPMHESAPPFPWATAGLAPLRSAAEAQDLGDFSPLWAGQHVAAAREIGAAELTSELARAWHSMGA